MKKVIMTLVVTTGYTTMFEKEREKMYKYIGIGNMIMTIGIGKRLREERGYKIVEEIGREIYIGIDGLSYMMIVMTGVIGGISIRVTRKGRVLGIITTGITEMMFSVIDIIGYFIWYEGVVIPMMLIIGWYGGKRKWYAAYKMGWYTIIGGGAMLIGIGTIYMENGTMSWEGIRRKRTGTQERERIIIGSIIIGCIVKIPLWPWHTWLPIAHTTAPTGGSVILAGVIIKAGAYALIRFIEIYKEGVKYYKPILRIETMMTIWYTSMTTLREVDIKKVIAYSSIGHMGLSVIGIWEREYSGATIIIFSHAFGASGMFISTGYMTERYKTRMIGRYTGMMETMPILTTIWFIIAIGNIGIPITGGFVGEMLVLIKICEWSKGWTILGGMTIVFGTGYTLWMWIRMIGGASRKENRTDIKMKEILTLITIIPWFVMIGIRPQIITQYIVELED